jgi:two-component system OmpR family response regulator
MEKILVIDDEVGIRGLMAAVLERKGYEVLLADSGQQGLTIFQRERPSVTILDLKMPEMDGFTVMKAIHTMDPNAPVVIFTGAVDADEEALRALGAVTLIRKEFSLHRLGETLKRLLHPPQQGDSRPHSEAQSSRPF